MLHWISVSSTVNIIKLPITMILFYRVTSVFLSIIVCTVLEAIGENLPQKKTLYLFLNKIRDIQIKVKSFAVLCGAQTSPDKQVWMRIGHWKSTQINNIYPYTGSVFLFYRFINKQSKVLPSSSRLGITCSCGFSVKWVACYVMEIWPILCFP